MLDTLDIAAHVVEMEAAGKKKQRCSTYQGICDAASVLFVIGPSNLQPRADNLEPESHASLGLNPR